MATTFELVGSAAIAGGARRSEVLICNPKHLV